jgi:hypothetical protein
VLRVGISFFYYPCPLKQKRFSYNKKYWVQLTKVVFPRQHPAP